MQESTEDKRSDQTATSSEGDIFASLKTATNDDRTQFSQELCNVLEEEPLANILSRIHDIVAAILMVSLDPDPVVRIYFVDKFANIFQQCQKHASPELEYYLNDLLLDIIVKYLHEGTKEIRRQAFVNLVKIIGLLSINKKKIEEKIFPAILDLSKNTDYETNIELNLMAIRLMGRTACVLGPEKTKELIIDRFLQNCSFRMDNFRKTCASVFPSICYAMGVEYTETHLLDHFFKLCKDSFWSVRKACAEAITSLSLLCSLKCRKERIAPVVLNLSKDKSKWVVCVMLKKLGPFISTFAEPCLTGLYFSDFGELYITNPTDEEFEIHASAELLANYQYYLDKFSETGAQYTTNNCQRRCYKDALSPEQIAQRIVENKTKLFEQVNYDTYLRKHMFSCLDSVLQLNNTAGESATFSEESEDFGDIKDVSILIDSFTETTNDESDIHKSHCSTAEDCSSSSSGSGSGSGSDSTCTLESCNTSETKEIQKKVGELHTKNRRIAGPSDLSSIIKKAIDEVTEHNKIHPPPLMRQMSRENITEIPSANSYNNLNKTVPTEDKSTIMDSLFQELGHITKVNTDSKVVPPSPCEIEGAEPQVKSRQKSCRRSDTYKTLSALQKESYFNGSSSSNNNDKEIDNILNKTHTDSAYTSSFDSNSEDDAFMEFNSHKYWYISPDLPLDPDLVRVESKSKLDDYGMLFGRVISHKLPTDYQQNTVPPEILKAYVNMVLYEDEEGINLNCAQNFPAVALTIGKSNWHLLKALLQYLCDDLDWKVRKTIASYIDLLAMILGREIASNDLLPIYVGFFKDLDEVKIKAIKNAANFLKVIDHQKHEDVLSRIGDCLRVDSKTNWRIKEDLAKQVLLLIRMYNFVDKQDSFLYITSLTALFLEDKISCVREIAADAMVEIIRIANPTELEGIVELFLVKEFARSDSWRKRQTFLTTLLKLIKCDQPPTDIFRLVFSSVTNLSYDAVPNVRLLVAKCLYELTKLDEEVFNLKDFEDVVSVAEIIRRLQTDTDRDVRDVLSGIKESTIVAWVYNVEICESSSSSSEQREQQQQEQIISVPEKKGEASTTTTTTSSTDETEIQLRDAVISESQT